MTGLSAQEEIVVAAKVLVYSWERIDRDRRERSGSGLIFSPQERSLIDAVKRLDKGEQ